MLSPYFYFCSLLALKISFAVSRADQQKMTFMLESFRTTAARSDDANSLVDFAFALSMAKSGSSSADVIADLTTPLAMIQTWHTISARSRTLAREARAECKYAD